MIISNQPTVELQQSLESNNLTILSYFETIPQMSYILYEQSKQFSLEYYYYQEKQWSNFFYITANS